MTNIAERLNPSSHAHLAPYVTYVRTLFAWVRRCFAVAQERHELQNLDRRSLQDIGVDRIDACREARRAFWDLPRDRP